MHRIYKGIIIILINSIFPTWVLAATQGSLGATSTGQVTVSITIPALVQISGLGNITLGSTSSFPALGNTTACIYSNVASPAGSYYVTATSQNSSGTNFRVNTGTDFIVYSAYWNNSAMPTQTTALTSSTKTAQQTNGNTTSLDCSGGTAPNANFNISFSASQVEGAKAATYTDQVTIVISPS